MSHITRCHRFESALWSSLYTQLSGVAVFHWYGYTTTYAFRCVYALFLFSTGSVLFRKSNRKPFEVCMGKVANERMSVSRNMRREKQRTELAYSLRERENALTDILPTVQHSLCVHAFANSQCVYINSLKDCSLQQFDINRWLGWLCSTERVNPFFSVYSEKKQSLRFNSASVITKISASNCWSSDPFDRPYSV